MKRLLLLLLTMGMVFTKTYAQISDNDAKVQYQKAEDAYEKFDYYSAGTITLDLYGKMKKWNPKILFMYIKAVYKNETDHRQQVGTNYFFPTSYKFYTETVNRCDTLLSLINVSTYPKEKLAEINSLSQYFKQKQEQKAFEKDRTPAKAIAFLNECIYKFRGNVRVGDPKYPSLQQKATQIYFKLDSPYLKVVSYANGYDSKTFKRHAYRVDLIDLSKVTQLQLVMGVTKVNLDGPTTYRNSNRVMDYYYYFNDEASVYKDPPKKSVDYNNRIIKDFTADTAISSPNHPKMVNAVEQPEFFKFFDTTSQEFIDGKYETRIQDALIYLIGYYPKYKPKENVIEKKNGF